MAAQGAGLVPPRNVVVSMRRLRVTCAHNTGARVRFIQHCGALANRIMRALEGLTTVCSVDKAVLVKPERNQGSCSSSCSQDIEIEMDRFEGTREAATKKYTFMDRPQGSAQEKADIAVDALATLIGAYLLKRPYAAAMSQGAQSVNNGVVMTMHGDIARQRVSTFEPPRPQHGQDMPQQHVVGVCVLTCG